MSSACYWLAAQRSGAERSEAVKWRTKNFFESARGGNKGNECLKEILKL